MSVARPAPPLTKDQLLARKIAYAIFIRCECGIWSIEKPDRMRVGVRREISAYAAQRRSDITAIVNAYPEASVSLPAGDMLVRHWQRELAAGIVIQLIREIIGTAPRFTRRFHEPKWTFLGRAPRNLVLRPLSPHELHGPQHYAVEDLYGSTDAGQVVVVFGQRPQHVVWGDIDGPGLEDPSAREAIRRLNLYEVWQRRQPTQLALPATT